MNKALWIARKNYLYALIKKVSDGQGCDEVEFINKHFQEVLQMNPDEKIEDAINCYESMVEQLKYYTKGKLNE